MAKYSNEVYLKYQFYNDRDVVVRCKTERIVMVRKPHLCAMCAKTMPVNTKMLCERAIVEGQWSSAYTCADCMDTWIDEVDGA